MTQYNKYFSSRTITLYLYCLKVKSNKNLIGQGNTYWFWSVLRSKPCKYVLGRHRFK